MTVYYADPQADANVPMKTRIVSGEHVPAHDILSLPGTVETDINSSSGFLSSLVTLMTTLAGTVTASRVAVDLSTTALTYLSNLTNIASNLVTLAGAITSSRMAVNVDSVTTGKLDTLHTDLGTTLHADLGAIATNQGVPSGGPKCGQNSSVGSGTDAQFGSQALTRGMVVTNLDTTNNLLVSHATGPTSTGSTTYVVRPTMSTPFIACSNATAVYMRSSTGTIAACYVGA